MGCQPQSATNAVRGLAGLAPFVFTPVAAGAPMRPAEITALRAAMGEALSILGMPVPAWIEGAATGKPVRGVHIRQLRNGVK